MNCWGNNPQLFYGAAPDSVLIAYDDLRTVNSKLIELQYEKDINKNLKEIIRNDSSIINNYSNNTSILSRKNKRLVRERNILRGVSITSIVGIILLLIK